MPVRRTVFATAVLVLNAIRHRKNQRVTAIGNFVLVPLKALLNLRWQCKILQILDLPDLGGIASSQPRFVYKYLGRGYLAKGLTVSKRAMALIHHYHYLHARMHEQFLREILYGSATLFETRTDANQYTITLGLSSPEDYEGELSLELRLNGTLISILSFTIVPGSIVDVAAEDAIMITRMQGARGLLPLVRLATRELGDVSPAALLFAAVNGVALACNITCIAGVSSANVLTPSEGACEPLRAAYDDFFASLGGHVGANGFFCFQVPLRERPITLVKRDHRSRTKKKRAYKAAIAESVRLMVKRNLRDQPPEPARESASPEAAM